MFGRMFSSGQGSKGSSGPRQRIARVEAGLVLLDSFAQDKSALVFDWDNCESVAHESRRNALRNTLVADISERRACGASPTWLGIRARLHRMSPEEKCSLDAENLLNDAATPLQHRCSSPRTRLQSGSSADGSEPRRVSLMFWPPEFIPASTNSCKDNTDDDIPDAPRSPPSGQAPPTPPRPRRRPESSPEREAGPSKSRVASVLHFALEDRCVPAAALFLASRRARAIAPLKGSLVDKDTTAAPSAPLAHELGLICTRHGARHEDNTAARKDTTAARHPSICDPFQPMTVLPLKQMGVQGCLAHKKPPRRSPDSSKGPPPWTLLCLALEDVVC